MDVLIAVLLPIALTAMLAGLGWLLKLVLDMSHRQTADEVKWQQNASEHERAFREIETLKAGQIRIEKKLKVVETKLDGIKENADG